MVIRYNPDEALRITGVRAMFEGETYTFDVHNEALRFRVILKEHELRSGFFEKKGKCCRYVANDPCTMIDFDLKTAIRMSIESHQQRAHHLVSIK